MDRMTECKKENEDTTKGNLLSIDGNYESHQKNRDKWFLKCLEWRGNPPESVILLSIFILQR